MVEQSPVALQWLRCAAVFHGAVCEISALQPFVSSDLLVFELRTTLKGAAELWQAHLWVVFLNLEVYRSQGMPVLVQVKFGFATSTFLQVSLNSLSHS